MWQARVGQTEPPITAAIGLSRRVVQEWMRPYNREGLAGLQDRSGHGRKLLGTDAKRWLRPGGSNPFARAEYRAIINQLLSQFSASPAPHVHAVMIRDGIGFHRSRSLSVPDDITLLPLPPDSAELNGIENLWHYLRSHCWSIRAAKNYDTLFERAENDWRK